VLYGMIVVSLLSVSSTIHSDLELHVTLMQYIQAGHW